MKKTFKKLIKHADKSRRKNGLSNDVVQHKITIKPDATGKLKASIRMALDLCEAVDLIIQSNDGIPENLDRKCFELTGLKLKDFTDFFIQFSARLMMANGVKDPEQKHMIMFNNLETIASENPKGGEPNINHQSDADFKRYITRFDTFMVACGYEGKEVKTVAKFIAVVCHHAETLYGGNSNDN